MAEPKGYKLFVNLGASQARRRLKGFGHGVRKVYSAGRDKAMIIHTATGDHLRALEAKFSDVSHATAESGLDKPMEKPADLGAASEVRSESQASESTASSEHTSAADESSAKPGQGGPSPAGAAT